MNSIELPYLTAARAAGPDAASFLQAQLTADLSRLADSASGFSAYCDPKGNVLALLRVIRRGDDYLLIAARDLMESLLSTLGKFVLRAKIRFEPVEAVVVGIGDRERLDYALEAGDFCGEVEAVSDWRVRELRAGIAWLGPQTSGQFLPQMLGFDRLGAVSFRKGCFPGQEVIARVRYLGKIKRLPLIVSFKGTAGLEPGAEVELHGEDGPAGSAVVVDSAASGNETVCFLLARNLEDRPVIALESGGKRLELSEPAQTWATM